MRLLRDLKNSKHKREFDRSVSRFFDEWLFSSLGITDISPPIKAGKYRRVYVTDSKFGKVVVKLYHSRRRKYVKNHQLAEQCFQKARVSIPKAHSYCLNDDVSEKYGLCSIVQEFVEGETFDCEKNSGRLADLAKCLASIHGQSSSQFGALGSSSPGDFWNEFFMPHVNRRVERMRSISMPDHETIAGAMRRWFSIWKDKPGSGIDGWSLLHWDLAPHNVIITPGNVLVFIDLDKCIFGLYGLELIRVPLKFIISGEQYEGIDSLSGFWEKFSARIDPVLNVYFENLPDSFKRDWEENRDFYLAWGMLLRAGTLSKGSAKLNPQKRDRAVRVWRNIDKAFREYSSL